MVDVLLKFKRVKATQPKLDPEREDFVLSESGGLELFKDDEWYSLADLWKLQVAWQANKKYKIAFGELVNVIDKMWLIGWLERNHYAM